MDYLFSMIKGAVRGFGEGAGLSGTGQTTLLDQFLTPPAVLGQAGAEWLMRFGVILAILLVCHKSVWALLKGFGMMIGGLFGGKFRWRKASRGQVTAICLLLASLPLLIAFLVRQYAFDYVGRFAGRPGFTGLMVLLNAGLLFLGDHSLDQNKELRDMKPVEAFKLGLFGVFSLLPGLSVVATAMAMGMNMGFKRKDAVEFSLLLAVPALLAGGPLASPLSLNGALLPVGLAAVAACMAAVGGILLLKWLENKDRLLLPTLYCGVSGVALVVCSLV